MDKKRNERTNSKILALEVYNILKQYSNEKNPISLKFIQDKLTNRHNKEIDMKAIRNTIDIILQYEPNNFICTTSEKSNGSDYKYNYYYKSELSKEENQLIELLLLNSRTINKDIIKRKSKKSVILPEYLYPKNNDVATILYKLKSVSEYNQSAKDKYIKVSFNFNQYNDKKQLEPLKYKNGTNKKYSFIPLGVAYKNNFFYLIAITEKGQIYNFRVDLITDLKIISEKIIVSNLKKIDIETYKKEHLYMFYGESKNIKLQLLKNDNNYTFVYDEFGDNFTVIFKNEGVFSVTAPVDAVVIFIRKWIDRIAVYDLENKTSQEILNKLKKSLESYL